MLLSIRMTNPNFSILCVRNGNTGEYDQLFPLADDEANMERIPFLAFVALSHLWAKHST